MSVNPKLTDLQKYTARCRKDTGSETWDGVWGFYFDMGTKAPNCWSL